MLIPVMLSGGALTRLRPVSREGHPKPLMKMADGQNLLQKTYGRAVALADGGEILTATNGEQGIYVNTNESTYIPAAHQHRFETPGVLDLVMIEVQSGEYLGEDDRVHFDDRYGRA